MLKRCRCFSGGNIRKEPRWGNPRDRSSQNGERWSMESHSAHEDGAAWRPEIVPRHSSQRNPPRISGTHREPPTHVSREQLWLRSTSQCAPVSNKTSHRLWLMTVDIQMCNVKTSDNLCQTSVQQDMFAAETEPGQNFWPNNNNNTNIYNAHMSRTKQ